jgi:hypothetical protein
MRRPALILVLLASAAVPALAGSRTIQIEPRPTYGATVTIEEGVRVFRPLPAGPRQVIVNPDRTPLILDVGQSTTINQSNSSSNVVVRRRGY